MISRTPVYGAVAGVVLLASAYALLGSRSMQNALQGSFQGAVSPQSRNLTLYAGIPAQMNVSVTNNGSQAISVTHSGVSPNHSAGAHGGFARTSKAGLILSGDLATGYEAAPSDHVIRIKPEETEELSFAVGMSSNGPYEGALTLFFADASAFATEKKMYQDYSRDPGNERDSVGFWDNVNDRNWANLLNVQTENIRTKVTFIPALWPVAVRQQDGSIHIKKHPDYTPAFTVENIAEDLSTIRVFNAMSENGVIIVAPRGQIPDSPLLPEDLIVTIRLDDYHYVSEDAEEIAGVLDGTFTQIIRIEDYVPAPLANLSAPEPNKP